MLSKSSYQGLGFGAALRSLDPSLELSLPGKEQLVDLSFYIRQATIEGIVDTPRTTPLLLPYGPGEDAGAARSLLREGAFDGLRDNIRRVATCQGTVLITEHTLSLQWKGLRG